MNCPRCKDDLRRTDRSGVEIDFCPRCRGVWLDGGELEKLLERGHSYESHSQGYPSGQQQHSSGGYQQHSQHSHHDSHDHRRDDHHRHDDHHRSGDHHYGHGHKPHKKKTFLGEIFDIFD